MSRKTIDELKLVIRDLQISKQKVESNYHQSQIEIDIISKKIRDFTNR